MPDVTYGKFEWDSAKARSNEQKHSLSFVEATQAFMDSQRIIAVDEGHSESEERYFCIGLVDDRVATVRFTYRRKVIRIIGAGYWRKGKDLYEKENDKD